MVFFVVGDNEYEFELSSTILDVKKRLIKELNLPCKYIDLEFCLERPMRVLGKFNVEPGKVPRPLDKNMLSAFAFKDKVKLSYTEVSDYDPDKPRTPLVFGARGRGRGQGMGQSMGQSMGRGRGLSQPPVNSLERAISTFNHNETVQEMNVEPTFDLSSNDDFPSLGN
tara:strand:- start:189 stop:692 length:504 start_codon:yes stop_codon:yes gene_type:complete